MRTLCMVAALALAWRPAAATSSIPCRLDPLIDAGAIRLVVRPGPTLSAYRQSHTRLPLDRIDRWEAFDESVKASLRDRLAADGIELESSNSWLREDRARYENTGAPHHALEIIISGRDTRAETAGVIAYAFLVEATLEAEFLNSELESVETYSVQRLGLAGEADLEAEVVSVITELVDEMIEFESCYQFPEPETLLLRDGALSLDLTPPGHGDLLVHYRSQADDFRHPVPDLPTKAALFAEPRDAAAQPLATFSLSGRYPPAEALVDDAARYLVTRHRYASRSQPPIAIHRADGSTVRGFFLHELLSSDDASARSEWARAGYDEVYTLALEGDRLVLSLHTGHYFGGEPADRIARIEIGLDDGELLSPKRSYLPRKEELVCLAADQPQASAAPPAPSNSFDCRLDWDLGAFADAAELPITELLPTSRSRPRPQYSAIARMAGVTGRVGLELLIAESGQVACVGIAQDLPFGLAEQARQATLQWRFAPRAAGSGPVRSHATFEFDIVLVPPRSESRSPCCIDPRCYDPRTSRP